MALDLIFVTVNLPSKHFQSYAAASSNRLGVPGRHLRIMSVIGMIDSCMNAEKPACLSWRD